MHYQRRQARAKVAEGALSPLLTVRGRARDHRHHRPQHRLRDMQMNQLAWLRLCPLLIPGREMTTFHGTLMCWCTYRYLTGGGPTACCETHVPGGIA